MQQMQMFHHIREKLHLPQAAEVQLLLLNILLQMATATAVQRQKQNTQFMQK